ncbi:hypothetical protein ACF06X_33200 [Streptomyces sp. NPDC015346]|uniref:hypothetical protein n=1 Tax=Streptomyces sp. NPDC015346 TaxID=3364954 RepID=UPI0036FE3E33
MGDYPWLHVPGEAAPMQAGVGVPPLDEELEGALDDLAGIHAGVDMFRDGIRLLAVDLHDADKTQTILTAIAGSGGVDLLDTLGLLVQRLTNPASNPALRDLDPETVKQIQQRGEQYAYETALYAPREHTNDIAGLISGP